MADAVKKVQQDFELEQTSGDELNVWQVLQLCVNVSKTISYCQKQPVMRAIGAPARRYDIYIALRLSRLKKCRLDDFLCETPLL